ncbi:MAG: DUF1440 domain-containing protein [Thermoleophilaceae bacterium]|nr:DUF1440 domain-containing protein [Thermoleophilaceae bacterium]
MSATTPLGAVGKGLVAGAVGTAAMTAVQTAVAKARDQEDSTTPAEVAKRIIRGVLQRDVPEEKTELLNNVMHWGYGTSWGAVYGLVQGTVAGSAFKHGALFGAGVWSASLVQLPAMKLAPPVWEYPPAELALEVGYHVVYGLGAAAAYAALDR